MSFESPFERAQVWITLEREGVVEQRSITVGPGNTTWPVPIAPRFAPNIWVGVLLVNQSQQAAAGANAADEVLRAGYAQLTVDSSAHMLSVAVQPTQPQLLPGDSAHVRVSVRDVGETAVGTGVRSEVTLWAVDEGVLSLTDYKTPHILRLIDERLGISSLLNSTLTELGWRSTRGIVLPGIAYRSRDYGLSARVAGMSLQSSVTSVGSTSASPISRSDFRLTAFFVGSTITDSNGTAVITGKLPDNITTFRLMATAVTKGERYGSGEAPLLVTRRVVVRPSLPRFVRLGDSLILGAALSVRDSANALLTVQGSASTGSLGGDSVQQVRLAGGQSSRAPFALAIPERTAQDSLVVKLSAIDNAVGDGDAITTVIPIRPAGTPRAHTVTGMVRGSANTTMSLPGNIDQSRSTVAVSLGTSPLVAMRTFYARLRDYTYYNTELLTTSARALLTLYRAERAMNEVVPTRDSASVAQDLQRAVDEISAREVEDEGLFANWPRTQQPENGWFSAYIGTFLLDADREGIKVSDDLLNRIAENLRELVKSKTWQIDTLTVHASERHKIKRLRFSERLVALRFLRDRDAPETAAEDSLIASANELSWEDRVGLVELLAERDDEERGLVMLNKLWSAISVAGKRIDIADSLRGSGSFPSRIRPAARLFNVTSELIPDHPLLGALAETIIQHGSVERSWAWNSLDYASAIEALGNHVSAQRGATGERVVARGIDGRVLFNRSRALAATQRMSAVDSVHSMNGLIRQAKSDSATFTVSMQVSHDSVATPVSRSTTPLYYSVTVNEVPLTRPVTPDVAGLTVERWYERLDSGVPVTSVNEGEIVRVRLRLTVPADRQYVTLEDLLPAGLEVVDLSLNTSATVGPFAKRSATGRRPLSRDEAHADSENQFASFWWSPWEYKESRDDRVFYFARELWSGSYYVSYLARATTAGTFVKPPAHAEEMYNKALQGRSDGGVFVVKPAKK